MSAVRPICLVALALCASFPTSAQAWRGKLKALDAEYSALTVPTTEDGSGEVRARAALVTPEGESPLECSAGARTYGGSGALSGLVDDFAAASFTLLGAGGKAIGTYAGTLGLDGGLDLEDISSRALSPEVTAFVADGVVTVHVGDTGEDVTGGLLVVGDAKAVVTFGAAETEWTCPLPAAESGTWEVKAWTERAFSPGNSGRTVWLRDDRLEAEFAGAWRSDKGSVPTLSFGDAGLTTVALLPPASDGLGWGTAGKAPRAHALVAVSAGWYPEDPIPASLQLEVVDGGTLVLPLNSAQRTGATPLAFAEDPTGREVEIRTASGSLRLTGGGHGQCLFGACFSLAESGSGWSLIATAYGGDAAALPDVIELSFAPGDGEKGGLVAPVEAKAAVKLGEEVAAVYGRAVTIAPDALGAAVAFEPSLIGLEQELIAQGTVMRGALDFSAGGFEFGTMSKTGPVQSKGDILIGGEPIGIERVGVGGKPEPLGPPVVWAGGGAGDRSAIPSTRNKPGLR